MAVTSHLVDCRERDSAVFAIFFRNLVKIELAQNHFRHCLGLFYLTGKKLQGKSTSSKSSSSCTRNRMTMKVAFCSVRSVLVPYF